VRDEADPDSELIGGGGGIMGLVVGKRITLYSVPVVTVSSHLWYLGSPPVAGHFSASEVDSS
jgi:hypothetical protein